MTNRLVGAVSPYLRSHADNPVSWWPWGEDAFAEAVARDVPVFVSIGYATCHWCHVMARESFSDPELAAYLNDRFVAIKVDREEHPEVDAAYLAAASAFTGNLGWPLSVFTTPGGAAFYAGTYFPPRAVGQTPSFRTVLDAVLEAWSERRSEVEGTAAAVLEALGEAREPDAPRLPNGPELDAVVARLAALDDPEYGGLGRASKFPNAPVIAFLIARGEAGDQNAAAFAAHLLDTMSPSPLRDRIEGGFFRYAVQRDWSEPHYERMLSDNAQLLALYTARGDEGTVTGLVSFLLDVLRLPSGAFASAQDSESPVDGVRSEGGYYALDAAARAEQPRPALDAKVLTGLNGLAVGALASAGAWRARPEWVAAAAGAVDAVLGMHLPAGPAGPIARASLDGRRSDAVATLEDVGGLAGGLLRLSLASGEPQYAELGRALVERCRDSAGGISAPDGGDPVLGAHGLAVATNLDDGATPSGNALLADAALLLWGLTGDDSHRRIAEDAIAPALANALDQPSAFGAALAIASRLASPLRQLIVVADDPADPLAALARDAGPELTAIVTAEQAAAFAAAGFGLFEARTLRDGHAAAYLCEHFVCALPVTTPEQLAPLL